MAYRLTEGQKRVLEDLLGRLERRTDPRRKITVRVTEDRFPEYFVESDPVLMRAWSEEIAALEMLGWVDLERGRGADSHRLARIILREERANQINEALGRLSADEMLRRFSSAIDERRAAGCAIEWVGAFMSEELARLKIEVIAGRDRASELEARLLVIDAIIALERNRLALESQGPVGWRQFCVREFGNSKRLESVRGRVFSVLAERAMGLEWRGTEWEDSSLLSHFGVLSKEEVLLFRGPVVFNGMRAEAWSPFFAVAVSMASRIDRWDFTEVRGVLTIENEEPFHLLCRQGLPAGWMALYLGGFPSRSKVAMLKAWRQAAPSLHFAHWGDLDAGGVAIHLFLERELGTEIRPIAMDARTLEELGHATVSLNPSELRRIERLMSETPPDHAIRETMTSLIQSGQKLEQEAVPLVRVIAALEAARER